MRRICHHLPFLLPQTAFPTQAHSCSRDKNRVVSHILPGGCVVRGEGCMLAACSNEFC